MKKLTINIALITIIILESFCMRTPKKNEIKLSKIKNIQINTLDALQGKWVSVQDTLNQVNISGRVYTKYYNNEDSIRNRKMYMIYFSDTVVNSNLPFSAIQIDIAAVTGKFMLIKEITDDAYFWCYKFEGFSNDSLGVIFSITDTWAKRKTVNYIKK